MIKSLTDVYEPSFSTPRTARPSAFIATSNVAIFWALAGFAVGDEPEGVAVEGVGLVFGRGDDQEAAKRRRRIPAK